MLNMLNIYHTNNHNFFRYSNFSPLKISNNPNKFLKNKTYTNSPSKPSFISSEISKQYYHNIKTHHKIINQLAKPAESKNIIFTSIINRNLSKHNSTKDKYYSLIITNIIYNYQTHFVSQFKDFLYWEDYSEFLNCFYIEKESLNFMSKIQPFNSNYKKYLLYPHYYFIRDCKKVIIDYYQINCGLLGAQALIEKRPHYIIEEKEKIFYSKILSNSATTHSKSFFNEKSMGNEYLCLLARTREISKNGRNKNQEGKNLYKNNLISSNGNDPTLQSLLRYFSDGKEKVKKKEIFRNKKIKETKKKIKLTNLKSSASFNSKHLKDAEKNKNKFLLSKDNYLNDLLLLKKEKAQLNIYKSNVDYLHNRKEDKIKLKYSNKTQSNSNLNIKLQTKNKRVKSFSMSKKKDKTKRKINTMSIKVRNSVYNVKRKSNETSDKKGIGLYLNYPVSLSDSLPDNTTKTSNIMINIIKSLPSTEKKKKFNFI